ncbi:hypothetical protein FRC01_000695 [Tulasnella sp. 417]|nr:hypothetical protein FRC01_000695 [Tulasnella sp. 417]
MASMYQQPPQPNVVYMAPQQPSQGTLMPGQSITLKHYTVTVERYLSQGGFAHVYLVRSAVPINGTTSHVLKRIAVSDEIMLKEVQKEVDVMKVLRGHPNIVNLIDSASFPHSNGTHEVFILMEYCAGGGIIDMMNRRLRERLTESEILTIFVEVLEGVACMHNLKPALLHRDLKVENILQASEKSYKLCDFGSAATAALKSPTTTAEIRAIEQDLLRHTTLQYRAPEMVDPYLRLPIDEKSDVWALGVLLYKLCYYTTPFEEHGPLAILNVHYKIPPYPVYSQNMINLIVSMLQKYGKDRPSVFDLLDSVHRLRGTRSQFSYNPPPPPISSLPPFSPAPPTSAQAFNTNAPAGFQPPRINTGFGNSNASANPYNVYVPDPNAKSPSPAGAAAGNPPGASSAAAARQHVLSAIQPMRRGRPGAIAPVISPTGGSTFAERDLLRSAAAGHDPDNQRKQQLQEQQPNASSPDALVHVRPEPSRYGQQWQRGKPLESREQQEPKGHQRQQGIVPTAQQPEYLDRHKANRFGPSKTNPDAPTAPNVSSGKTPSSFKVNDDGFQLHVHSGAGGRPTSASPSANASANSGGRTALEAWDLRGPVTGGGGGDRKAGGGGVEIGGAGGRLASFDGFADTFDFGGTDRDAGSSGLAAPMQATRSSATTAAAAGGLSTSAPGSVSTLFHMYNPPTTTTSTAAASSATSALNNSTNLIPPTSTRVPTRTGPGAFNSGKRDAFDGLAGVNFGSGSGAAAAQTMGAIQSLNTPPISTTTGNLVASRASPRLIPPPSPGRGSRTPASVTSELSAEERFPSIEDYERGSPAPGLSASLQPPAGLSSTTDWRKALTPSPSGPSTNSAFHRPALTPQPSTMSVKPGSVVGYGGAGSHVLPSGARSQHTTGTAMKDAEHSRGSAIRAGSGFTSFQMADPNPGTGLHRRQSLNISSKSGPGKPIEPALPPRPAAKKPELGVGGLGPRRPSAPPKDWLTGQDTGSVTSPTATTSTSPPVPITGGAPGLTRKLSASFIRRASQYGELQQMGTGQSRKPGPPVPDKTSVPANRPTSDTSGDEGPEDATGSLGNVQGSRFRQSHTGRKQGSVYDLVDVGSGSRQPPPPSAKKSFDQFGRRQQSVHDLVDVTSSEAAASAPTSLTTRPRAESPQPLPSAKTAQSAEFRFPPIEQSSPPSPRAEGVGGRRRPQSMFLSPSQSSLQVPRSPAEPQVPESPKTPGAQPESPRKIRHPRRNSIVDLVSKYEAMDAAAGARAAVAASTPKSPGGPPPPIASKPATLQGHARNTSVTKRPSLDIPAPMQQGGRSTGPRTSPTIETSGRRMSISPSRRVPSPASLDFSQQQVRAPTPSRPQFSPVLSTGPTRPITPPTHSPSPERPYQGVASLISQWQKKSESSANPSRSSPKTWK